MKTDDMIAKVRSRLGDKCGEQAIGLVAPRSSTDLDIWSDENEDGEFVFEKLCTYTKHVGLDDLDLAGDGVWGSVQRVVGRRGLSVWRIGRRCGEVGEKGVVK